MNDKTLDPMQQRAARLRMWGLLAHWSEIDPGLRQKLCDWQETERRNRSLAGRLATSRLGRFKPMADFDWKWPFTAGETAIPHRRPPSDPRHAVLSSR